MDKVIPKLGDEIPQEWLNTALKEIRSQYRTITLDSFREKENVDIRIYQPTEKENSILADARAKVYSKLIRDEELLTIKEMLKVLKKRGIWGDEEDSKLENIQEECKDIEYKVNLMRKNEDADFSELKKQWLKKKSEFNDLLAEKNSLLSNTIERLVDNEEIKLKLSLCVKFDDGTLVWDSVDALNDETDRVAMNKILNEALLFWSGLSQEIIDALPSIIFGGEEESEN